MLSRAMGNETWETREQPILEAVFELEEKAEFTITMEDVQERTGLERPEVARALRALMEALFVTGASITVDGEFEMSNIRLHERGRRAVGQWPSDDAFAVVIRVLEARLESETDPAARSRLQKLLSTVTEVGTDVVGGVLTAAVKEIAGL